MKYDVNIKDIFERAGSLLIQTLLKKKIKKYKNYLKKFKL